MVIYIRYMLATVCFAASFICFVLWACGNEYTAGIDPAGWCVRIDGSSGLGCISIEYYDPSLMPERRVLYVSVSNRSREAWFEDAIVAKGRFGVVDGGFYFPLWYPALIFALAGVAALRFRRQFSIRSALVALSIVAALLGMAVAL